MSTKMAKVEQTTLKATVRSVPFPSPSLWQADCLCWCRACWRKHRCSWCRCRRRRSSNSAGEVATVAGARAGVHWGRGRQTIPSLLSGESSLSLSLTPSLSALLCSSLLAVVGVACKLLQPLTHTPRTLPHAQYRRWYARATAHTHHSPDNRSGCGPLISSVRSLHLSQPAADTLHARVDLRASRRKLVSATTEWPSNSWLVGLATTGTNFPSSSS